MLLYESFIPSNRAAFVEKVKYIAGLLKCDPNDLMIVMYAESRLKPNNPNPISRANGLIQFMPKTAVWLGTTVEAIAKMSNLEQLDYVYKYFKMLGGVGKIKNVYDLYMLTFFPAALGKPDDWVLQSGDLTAYKVATQNKIIDINKDFKITVAEFNQYVSGYLKKKTSAQPASA